MYYYYYYAHHITIPLYSSYYYTIMLILFLLYYAHLYALDFSSLFTNRYVLLRSSWLFFSSLNKKELLSYVLPSLTDLTPLVTRSDLFFSSYANHDPKSDIMPRIVWDRHGVIGPGDHGTMGWWDHVGSWNAGAFVISYYFQYLIRFQYQSDGHRIRVTHDRANANVVVEQKVPNQQRLRFVRRFVSTEFSDFYKI